MNTVSEKTVKKLMQRIYNDALIKNEVSDFVILKYSETSFLKLLPHKEMHDIIGFLPNLRYNSSPLVMDVTFDIGKKFFKITVINPKKPIKKNI
jgi:hypothetical protein